MSDSTISEDWNHILQFLPSDMSELAKDTGAVTRWRNIRNGETFLRLILAYTVEDLSLRTTAAWSARSDAQMKDTSVLHRLRHAVPFLESVLAHLLNHRISAEQAAGVPLRINDATVISIPGSQGTDWRIHAVYDPIGARLVRVQVTDWSGGERLTRDTPQPGEIVIADRGLAHARGVHATARAGAYTLLRVQWKTLGLRNAEGEPLDLDEVMKRANRGDRVTYVGVPLEGEPPVGARLLVVPVPQAQAERARRKLRRNAQKKGRQPGAQSLRLAGYFAIVTTVPEELASNSVALELYRVRWQIELFFKRCKSLLHLDHLRADDPALVQTYCLAKLIEVVLVELLSTEGESFSPWGVPRTRRPAAQLLASLSNVPD